MHQILVIDDSPTAVVFVREALDPALYEVRELENFVELPVVLRRTPPDLVMLDMELPALHGRTFGRFIRQFEDRALPIVIYSARPRRELEEVAKEIGAAGIVEKGTSPAALRHILATVLHTARREAPEAPPGAA